MAIDKLFEDNDCVGCSAPQAVMPPPTTNRQWYIGPGNTWWLGDYNSKVNAMGIKGDKGDTPYIGTNNNWWIGNTDTGVPASGNTTVDMPSPESATDLFD